MALIKEIIQDDGVPTSYHRVLFVQSTPGRQTSIAVVSYVSAEVREGEIAGTIEKPYQKSVAYETDYDPAMSVSRAYDWLKANVPEFEGAQDDGAQDGEISGDEFVSMLEEVL